MKQYLPVLIMILLLNSCANEIDTANEESPVVNAEETAKAKNNEAAKIKEKPKASTTTKKSVRKYAKTKSQRFDYQLHTRLKVQLPVVPTILDAHKTAPREFTYQGSTPPKDWQVAFYNMFLNRKDDVEVLKYLVAELTNLAKQKKVSPLEMVVAYVQGAIQYDHQKAKKYKQAFLQYPYETAFYSQGVCSDKSVLLTKMLNIMDYNTVFFEFPNADHIAVGVRVPSGYGNFGTNYSFIETTNYNDIGVVPDSYVQGIQLTEKPFLIFPDNNGKKTFNEIKSYTSKRKKLEKEYGEGYAKGNSAQKKLAIELKEIDAKVKSLKKEHQRKGCGEETVKTDAEFNRCVQLTNQINDMVEEYNKVVNQYNNASPL